MSTDDEGASWLAMPDGLALPTLRAPRRNPEVTDATPGHFAMLAMTGGRTLLQSMIRIAPLFHRLQPPRRSPPLAHIGGEA